MDSTSCANHPIRATARLFLAALPLLLAPAVSWGSCTDCPELVGPPAPATPVQPAPIPWYGAREVRREALAVCAVSAADLATTEAVLAAGGDERNPLIRNRALRVGVSALGCYGLLRAARTDPEAGRKWARIALVVRGLAFAWNVRELAR